MTLERRVIVVIGQVASGKTSVARELGRRLAGRVSGIEQLRAAGSDTSPSGVARELASLAGSGIIVYECSGAHPDFEETLSRSKRAGSCPLSRCWT